MSMTAKLILQEFRLRCNVFLIDGIINGYDLAAMKRRLLAK